MPKDLTDQDYNTLVALVTIAKNHQTEKVDDLKILARSEGFSEESIENAIQFWGSKINIRNQ